MRIAPMLFPGYGTVAGLFVSHPARFFEQYRCGISTGKVSIMGFSDAFETSIMLAITQYLHHGPMIKYGDQKVAFELMKMHLQKVPNSEYDKIVSDLDQLQELYQKCLAATVYQTPLYEGTDPQ